MAPRSGLVTSPVTPDLRSSQTEAANSRKVIKCWVLQRILLTRLKFCPFTYYWITISTLVQKYCAISMTGARLRRSPGQNVNAGESESTGGLHLAKTCTITLQILSYTQLGLTIMLFFFKWNVVMTKRLRKHKKPAV